MGSGIAPIKSLSQKCIDTSFIRPSNGKMMSEMIGPLRVPIYEGQFRGMDGGHAATRADRRYSWSAQQQQLMARRYLSIHLSARYRYCNSLLIVVHDCPRSLDPCLLARVWKQGRRWYGGEGKRVRDEREKRVTSAGRLPGHGNFNVL